MKVEKILCDRCKAEIVYPVKRKLFLSALRSEGGLDLCNSCYDELTTWFSNNLTHITEKDNTTLKDLLRDKEKEKSIYEEDRDN